MCWNPFRCGAMLWLLLTLASGRAAAGPVESLLRDEMAAHHVAGLACLVIQDGRTTTHFYAGCANLEWSVPVAADTVFEIGSVSKQFAAAAILLLAQDGKLSVNDPISRYLPNTPPAWQDVRIRHLLSHTSGIRSYDALDGFEMRQHLTQARFLERLAAQPMNFAPGTNWAYCNAGFSLLGYIVENVSHTNYWAFLQQRIFTPLHMEATTRRDPWLVIPHRAAGYVYAQGTHTARDYDLTDLFAAGAIVSTVGDLAKWDAAIVDDTLLKEPSRRLWWTPAQLASGKPAQTKAKAPEFYGFGWFIRMVNGHRNIGHTGITSGFSAANELFPDDHLAIIILSNTDEGTFAGDLARKVAERLLKPVREPVH